MTNATRLQLEARMDRFGLKLASHLDEQPLSHNISERLRVARQQALAQRKKELNTAPASSVSMSGGAAVLGGGEGLNWFSRMASALPLVALVAGLITISINVDDDRANELAEVDMQLLTDDLPPAAHTDVGFAQYLKFGPPIAGGATGSAQ
jgi:Protein of unknown function (DUF3619)